MCLIIQRPANITLDYESFKTAVENNPHGYGLSTPDYNGGLLTLRDHNKPDVDTLYKLVNEEFKDQRVMLHLRYTTAGSTNLRNAHPFPILERKTDGVDLRMAHNGTLFSYKGNTSESDTRRFVRMFVRPLFKRLRRGMDIEDILSDPFISELLDSQLTSSSVISFIDGNGNTLEVNAKGNGGYYSENGVFYSNKYSFTKGHREPKTQSSYAHGGGYSGGRYHEDYSKWWEEQEKEESKKKSNVVTGSFTHAKDTQVEKFSEKFSIDPYNFADMTDDFITTLVRESEEDTVSLIKELIFELTKAQDELLDEDNIGLRTIQ